MCWCSSRAGGSRTRHALSRRPGRAASPLTARVEDRIAGESRRISRSAARQRGARGPAGSGERTSTARRSTGWAKARRAACRNWRSRPRAPARAVLRVARDRVADRLQVHADLVRAAGLQAHAQQRRARQRALEREVRARRARRRRCRSTCACGRGGRGRSARRSCPCAPAGGPRPARGTRARPRARAIARLQRAVHLLGCARPPAARRCRGRGGARSRRARVLAAGDARPRAPGRACRRGARAPGARRRRPACRRRAGARPRRRPRTAASRRGAVGGSGSSATSIALARRDPMALRPRRRRRPRTRPGVDQPLRRARASPSGAARNASSRSPAASGGDVNPHALGAPRSSTRAARARRP